MPLDSSIIHSVAEYYHRDIGTYSSYIRQFDFIDDENLRKRLAQEFYIARYAAKLQEALAFDENFFELLGHLKLQIIQYAGIYEAVISYLLLNKFPTHQGVIKLGKRIEYRKVDALAASTQIQHKGEEVFLCRQAHVQDQWVYVRFEDKLKAAQEIGFLKEPVAKTILDTYKLRHSVHIEKAVKDEIIFEMEQCKQAYLMMRDFTNGIKSFFIPEHDVTAVESDPVSYPSDAPETVDLDLESLESTVSKTSDA